MKIAESSITGWKTLGKGEIACYEQFLLFPECFQVCLGKGKEEVQLLILSNYLVYNFFQLAVPHCGLVPVKHLLFYLYIKCLDFGCQIESIWR